MNIKIIVSLVAAMMVATVCGQELPEYKGVPDTMPTTSSARKVYNLKRATYVTTWVTAPSMGQGGTTWKDHSLKEEEKTFERITQIISGFEFDFEIANPEDRIRVIVHIYSGRERIFSGGTNFYLENTPFLIGQELLTCTRQRTCRWAWIQIVILRLRPQRLLSEMAGVLVRNTSTSMKESSSFLMAGIGKVKRES